MGKRKPANAFAGERVLVVNAWGFRRFATGRSAQAFARRVEEGGKRCGRRTLLKRILESFPLARFVVSLCLERDLTIPSALLVELVQNGLDSFLLFACQTRYCGSTHWWGGGGAWSGIGAG